jgi:RNA polymerase sigma factor (TIGR02999 family)
VNEASRLASAAEQGDAQAAERLLPLVYDELRRLASRRLEREAPGQTLEATALVHEAYLRLLGADPGRRWDGRRHFFAAAAEAMRRILVDRARDRRRLKRGGGMERVDLDLGTVPLDAPGDDLIDLDEALLDLGREDPLCGSRLLPSHGLRSRIPEKVGGRVDGFRQALWSFLLRGGSPGTAPDPWKEKARAVGRLPMGAAAPSTSERKLS